MFGSVADTGVSNGDPALARSVTLRERDAAEKNGGWFVSITVIVTVEDAILPEVSVTKKGSAYDGAELKLRVFRRIRVPLSESIVHVPLASVSE
jgi:hypothetical protein